MEIAESPQSARQRLQSLICLKSVAATIFSFQRNPFGDAFAADFARFKAAFRDGVLRLLRCNGDRPARRLVDELFAAVVAARRGDALGDLARVHFADGDGRALETLIAAKKAIVRRKAIVGNAAFAQYTKECVALDFRLWESAAQSRRARLLGKLLVLDVCACGDADAISGETRCVAAALTQKLAFSLGDARADRFDDCRALLKALSLLTERRPNAFIDCAADFFHIAKRAFFAVWADAAVERAAALLLLRILKSGTFRLAALGAAPTALSAHFRAAFAGGDFACELFERVFGAAPPFESERCDGELDDWSAAALSAAVVEKALEQFPAALSAFLAALRALLSGAAAMPPRVADAFLSTLSRAPQLFAAHSDAVGAAIAFLCARADEPNALRRVLLIAARWPSDALAVGARLSALLGAALSAADGETQLAALDCLGALFGDESAREIGGEVGGVALAVFSRRMRDASDAATLSRLSSFFRAFVLRGDGLSAEATAALAAADCAALLRRFPHCRDELFELWREALNGVWAPLAPNQTRLFLEFAEALSAPRDAVALALAFRLLHGVAARLGDGDGAVSAVSAAARRAFEVGRRTAGGDWTEPFLTLVEELLLLGVAPGELELSAVLRCVETRGERLDAELKCELLCSLLSLHTTTLLIALQRGALAESDFENGLALAIRVLRAPPLSTHKSAAALRVQSVAFFARVALVAPALAFARAPADFLETYFAAAADVRPPKARRLNALMLVEALAALPPPTALGCFERIAAFAMEEIARPPTRAAKSEARDEEISARKAKSRTWQMYSEIDFAEFFRARVCAFKANVDAIGMQIRPFDDFDLQTQFLTFLQR